MSYQIDRYIVEKELGRGAFGAVYLARHVVLGSQVALKVLHPSHSEDAKGVDRFLREARAAASVGSPHIVRVTDAGVSAEGHAFLAMELLEGEDLASYLTRRGRLPPKEAVGITMQALDGLAAAHAAGIVHRDMKPGNVFLTRDARGAPVVKLLDFGVSKMRQPHGLQGSLTATGVIVGTPHYMAPEQLVESRSVDARADLYSVGVMLYELLSGRLPFDAETFGALFHQVLTAAPVDLRALQPDLPPGVVACVHHALAREPDKRFSSAREMRDALGGALEGVPIMLPIPETLSTAPTPLAGTYVIGGPVAAASPTAPMSGASTTTASTPSLTSAPRARGWMVVLGAILLVCPLATCGAGLVVRTRLAAAWDAFLGVERETRSEPRDPADSTEAPQRDEPRPPEIPLHDGREEQIGGVAISVERCSRRRADDGRWLVDMPITLRNVGDDAMTFQRSELSVDGYVATGESSLPVFGMAATGRSFSGHMVWRATGDGAPADTVTVRFRGWARRVPVGDGPRLPPRP